MAGFRTPYHPVEITPGSKPKTINNNGMRFHHASDLDNHFSKGKPKPKPSKSPKPRKMPSEAELRKGYNESAAGKRGGYTYGDYILTVRSSYGYKNQMDK